MAPRGLGSLIGMPLIGLLVGKIDARKLARRTVWTLTSGTTPPRRP